MKTWIAAIALLLTSATAFADGLEGEVGYSYIGTDVSDVNLGAIYGYLGYNWQHEGSYSSSAEVLLAIGIKDDNFGPVNVELKPSFAVGYKGTVAIQQDFSLFWRAHYATVDAEADAFGSSAGADESGIGVGVGANYKFVTFGYTKYLGDLDGLDTINLGVRFAR